jgi:hypothetical protein
MFILLALGHDAVRKANGAKAPQFITRYFFKKLGGL